MMLPAYFTALGTSSSAASIPVTHRAALNNGISKPIAGFVIPLCATIHLSGSMIKLTLYGFAVVYLAGLNVSLTTAAGFILLLRSEEHTSELQSRGHLVCRLLLEKKK